jgi:hypothetical protein
MWFQIPPCASLPANVAIVWPLASSDSSHVPRCYRCSMHELLCLNSSRTILMVSMANSQKTLWQREKAKSSVRLCKITSVGKWAHGGDLKTYKTCSQNWNTGGYLNTHGFCNFLNKNNSAPPVIWHLALLVLIRQDGLLQTIWQHMVTSFPPKGLDLANPRTHGEIWLLLRFFLHQWTCLYNIRWEY